MAVKVVMDEIYDEAIEVKIEEDVGEEDNVKEAVHVPGIDLQRVINQSINASLDRIPEEKEPLSCLISPTNDSAEQIKDYYGKEASSRRELLNLPLDLGDKNLISPAVAAEDPMTPDSARLLRSLPKARSIQEIIKDHNIKSKQQQEANQKPKHINMKIIKTKLTSV